MLTLAEEIGLGGYHLASRVRKAFRRLPQGDQASLIAAVQQEAAAAAPRLLAGRPAGRDRRVSLARDGFARPDFVPPLRLADGAERPQAAAGAVLSGFRRPRGAADARRRRKRGCWQCWGPSQRDNNPIFGRLDAVIDFTSPMWKNSLQFMEPNMSGIGGLHMVPTAERIIAERACCRGWRRRTRDLQLELAPDIRELLMQEIRDHLEAIGRRGPQHLLRRAQVRRHRHRRAGRRWPATFTTVRPEGHARRSARAVAGTATKCSMPARRSIWSIATTR